MEVRWEVQIQTVLQGVTLRVCPEILSVLSVEEDMLSSGPRKIMKKSVESKTNGRRDLLPCVGWASLLG